MPDGKRRRLLGERFKQFLTSTLNQRILPLGERATQTYDSIL